MENENDESELNFPLYIELARMTGSDAAVVTLECYFEDTARLAHNFLSCGGETEDDPPIEPLQHSSTLYRAGRLFMAIYNGSYIRLNEKWAFQEVMPDHFHPLPVSDIRNAEKRLSAGHLKRIREQAAWEIQGLMAGMAAEMINDDPAGPDAERLLEAFWPPPPEWGVLFRVQGTITDNDDGRTKDFFLRCAEQCISILTEHWDIVLAIDLEVGAFTPNLKTLLASVGVQGKRFASDSPNAVLFDVFRSEVVPKTDWARPISD